MNANLPTFAVVGAVNHGKSSVVSTLAENDEVRISSMPGETVDCQRFALRDLFVFYDTPGFQNALEALEELAPAGRASDPLEVFRGFVERHRDDPAFEAECRLFRPLLDGAGILYVVDGSEPVSAFHAAEMEILRLSGRPRVAVINRTGRDDHVDDWKRRLGLHFNAVREFDAHRARFADRVELLETLAAIELDWKPRLNRAVTLLRAEAEQRLAECAEILVELLVDVLGHREVSTIGADRRADRGAVGEHLKRRYEEAVTARELRAHRAIIERFGHRRVSPDREPPAVLAEGLFADETWRVFGLDRRQLVAAGAVGGAAAGVGVDVVAAGHTLLAGAIVGGVLGAAGAVYLGHRRPEWKVKMPGFGRFLRVGGEAVSVGPCTAVNFPWILVDRALATYCYVANRAHARRDDAVVDSARIQAVLEAAGVACTAWPEGDRRACERAFGRIRRGRLTPDDRRALGGWFREHLARAGEVRLADDLTGAGRGSGITSGG